MIENNKWSSTICQIIIWKKNWSHIKSLLPAHAVRKAVIVSSRCSRPPLSTKRGTQLIVSSFGSVLRCPRKEQAVNSFFLLQRPFLSTQRAKQLIVSSSCSRSSPGVTLLHKGGQCAAEQYQKQFRKVEFRESVTSDTYTFFYLRHYSFNLGI